MTVTVTAIAFIVAAGLGAAVRHAVNLRRATWRGTLAINVIGALLLGVLVGSDPSSSTLTVAGAGFLGTLTTFSMFALEMVEATRWERLGILAATLVVGIGAAAIGFAVV